MSVEMNVRDPQTLTASDHDITKALGTNVCKKAALPSAYVAY